MVWKLFPSVECSISTFWGKKIHTTWSWRNRASIEFIFCIVPRSMVAIISSASNPCQDTSRKLEVPPNPLINASEFSPGYFLWAFLLHVLEIPFEIPHSIWTKARRGVPFIFLWRSMNQPWSTPGPEYFFMGVPFISYGVPRDGHRIVVPAEISFMGVPSSFLSEIPYCNQLIPSTQPWLLWVQQNDLIKP